MFPKEILQQVKVGIHAILNVVALLVLVWTGRTAGKGISIGSDSIEIFSPLFSFYCQNYACRDILRILCDLYICSLYKTYSFLLHAVIFAAFSDVVYFCLSKLKPYWAYLACCKFSTKVIYMSI